MSPLAILVVALAVVIGGVLRFRWHAFLVLVVGALAVAALTPRTSILRFELGRETVTLHVLSADRKRGEVVDPKGVLEQGTRHPIFRLQAGEPPRRIGEAVLGDPGASERPGRGRAVEIVSTAPGESPRPGDAIVPAGAAKTAVRTAGLSLGQRVAEGFGKTALDIGILIAMASILGTCLMEARGAEAIVAAVQRVVGVARTSWVFLGTGFLLGIPMFAEAVFYVLLPLAKATWRTTRRRYVLSVLAIVAGATMTHSLVPPTPGPLFVANALGVSMPAMMLHGMLVGAVAAMAGYAYALWADGRWPIPLREPTGPPSSPEGGHADATASVGAETLPPVLPSLVPILLPVLLISAAAAMESGHGGSLPAGLVALVRVVGDKNLALTISAGLAVALLTWRRRAEPGAVRSAIRSAVVEAGEIILIIAAGGSLGQVLRQAGMAELVGAVTPDWKPALIPMAWAITALIRVAQGSATVAMITAVGIVGPSLETANLGFHPVYVALAIGCGSKIGMWMNDSGFWVISKMSGLTETETLKTASTMVFIEGCVGLIATFVLALLWPMA